MVGTQDLARAPSSCQLARPDVHPCGMRRAILAALSVIEGPALSSIHLIRPHPIGLAAARAEVDRLARRVQEDYGADFAWHGDTLVFSHLGVSGRVQVSAGAIDLRVRLGLLLSPMKAQVEAVLLEKFDRALTRHPVVNPAQG